MWSAPFLAVMMDGSCAIRGCEPCQVGDQAALSSLSGVPQGCLFGTDKTVNVRRSVFDGKVYGSIRHIKHIYSAYAE